MVDKCYLLGSWALPDGSCAQWYSGTASFFAVIVALGGHFYSAWRQSKADDRDSTAEIAGTAMLLRGLSKDIEGNAIFLFKSASKITAWGQKFVITRMLGAAQAFKFDFPSKSQSDVLIRIGCADLAEKKIYFLVGKHNLLNTGIEELSRMRAAIQPTMLKFVEGIESHFGENTEEAKSIIKELHILDDSVKYFHREVIDVCKITLSAIEDFNELCALRSGLTRYLVNRDHLVALLKRFEPTVQAEQAK